MNAMDLSNQKAKSAKACFLQEEKLMILKDDNSIEEVTIDMFLDLIGDDPEKLREYRVFASDGWTMVTEIHMRSLWENEKVYKIKTRSSEIHTTAEAQILIIRSNKEASVYANQIQDGDALEMFVPMRLKDDQKGKALTRQIMHQGVMKCEPLMKYPAKLVGFSTESGTISINDIITVTNRD